MEAKREEALKVKEIAEKHFAEKDFLGAKNYALKAKLLYPGLEGISQLVTTFDVYAASRGKFSNAIDYYAVLGLKPSADRDTVKKQYKKMAVLLHPDKNKSVGADGAFKLVSEAWTWLSDRFKRSSYDLEMTNVSSMHTDGVTGYNSCSNSSKSRRLDTFWTVCSSCKIQYEYLRKYVNKRLSCKNCRGTFIAVETGSGPLNGSFPYSPLSYVPGNGYGSQGFDGVAYGPTGPACYTGHRYSRFHSGHNYDYVSNMSYHWGSIPAEVVYQSNGNVVKVKHGTNGKSSMKNAVSLMSSSACRPDKKRKVVGASVGNGYEKKESKSSSEAKLGNGNANIGHDLSSPREQPARRCSVAPAFDARKLLMDKARTEIQKKMEEIKLASAAASAPEAVTKAMVKAEPELPAVLCHQAETTRTVPGTITVPDPDFHDFDKDRSEKCFKPKQIWAIYDEDDGMPRLYCLIRQVISVKPFKIHITYLNSKTDSEFGLVNWLASGFTKSCGNFRASTSDEVDQVNIFSHVLTREKAGRGGCVRIYPKSGDIWAVYRNWSPNWNRSTPGKVHHQYEMVEVLDDYSEELGVCVTPLVKTPGFKTVYQRTTKQNAVQWIPRREMLRFSHQVPSCLLKEAKNLPNGCWDLDPAATPDELLHAIAEVKD